MCGRYTLSTDAETLVAEFGIDDLASWTPRFNIAPSQLAAALVLSSDRLKAARLHWGLVPGWAKDKKISARLINARAETVAEKPSFRAAFARRRCLVLADGYYEWVKRGESKQAMYFTRDDRRPFAFAGLWESWQDADTEPLHSCTIITCAANDDIQALHHRMPVVLEKSDYDTWLRGAVDRATHIELLKPAANGVFSAIPVSNFVNAPSHEGPDCIAPARG